MAVELTKEEEKTEWYSVLGLESTADDAAISKAFKKLSLRWHPDKNQGSKEAEKMFMMVKEAKNFLLDAKKRKIYDEKRNARLKAEAQLAEQYRNMGQKRRQLREELERREKGVANGVGSGSGSVGLGAGGEARLVAELKRRGEEMRKRQGREREQKRREQEAAMESEFERASAKKQRDGSNDDGDDFEDRTVRVKWSTKKESHSDHTLAVLFSQFGVVESVSIEAGSGNKALVTFALPTAADAAVAHFNEDHETMRASHVGKKRAKRNSFAPRRESLLSPPATPMSEGGGSAASTPSSLRDKESLVMMKLRQEAERQALIRQMAADEGISVEQAGGSKPSPVSPAVAKPSGASRINSQRNVGGSGDANGEEPDGDEAGKDEGTAAEGGETKQRAAGVVAGAVNSSSTSNPDVVGDGGVGIGERGKEQQQQQPTSSFTSPTGTNSVRSSFVTPVFPYPCPRTPATPVFPSPSPRTPAAWVGRDRAKVSSMKRGVEGSSPLSTPIGAGIGFDRMGVNLGSMGDKSGVSTPTAMAAGGSTLSSSVGGSPLDESDILARMMRFK